MSYVWILAVDNVIYLPSWKSITISNNRITQVLVRAKLVALFDEVNYTAQMYYTVI